MKKTMCLLLLLIFLFSFVSCRNVISNNLSSETHLLSALKSEITFIAEDGKNIYLQDFAYASDESTEYYAKPQEYAFIDFDGDNVDELVVDITPNQVYYMVFHKNNDDVYGFLIGRRSLQSIKEDGSFIQTGGADINCYCKMEFDNDSYEIIDTAIKNETDGIYEINGKESTFGAVNEYIEAWNLKKDAEWIKVS